MSHKLVREIFQILRLNQGTLSLAESCTGGYISHIITNIEGSSEFFKGGFVTYSLDSKFRDLGIDQTTYQQYGVYSKEMAEAMSVSIKQIFGTTLGISTTGLAPPGEDNSSEEVGKICIGIASDQRVISKTVIIDTDNRQDFKEKASKFVLDFLKEEFQKLVFKP